MKFKYEDKEVSIKDTLDRVLVRLDRETPTQGLILKPYYERTFRLTGKVVMVGSRYKGPIKEGQTVVYREDAGVRVGDIYTIFRPEEDFLAILEKE